MSLTTPESACTSVAPCAASAATHPAAAPCPPVAARRGEVAVPLTLRHAGRREVTLRYEILGEAGLPAVLVAGGISAHRHLASSERHPSEGWWEVQVGPGRALDPTRRQLIALDWLGADGTIDAVIDPADQADAIAALLDALGIARLHGFVGSSYGAMVGLQFAARHGARVGQLVAISGAHRAHPFSSAWRALQRRAVALGALQCDEIHGLALARQLAILSYRTPEEFDERFGAPQVVDGCVRVAAEDYLDHCGSQFAARVSPVAFARLSESIDLQLVEPEAITRPVTVVAVAQDRLVPLEDCRALAARLGGPRQLHVIDSLFGHDAFLKEVAAIAAIVAQALDETSTPHLSPVAVEVAA
ncbi:homoserine O-succinyltransferase MetX [Agrilutibacter solisilvae]|uniref:Homoserine O-succinyltransferase n=1 Tax=Agrilutibacter solisilvae TaxID=2763317 RepID=A0A974XZ35_9GAMM|nr:homoserine O-succinyltransferase [Lysobacter solisilvae]QSX78431.1 homoserine O-succinyltransferase [Lysobacter solisilvae]